MTKQPFVLQEYVRWGDVDPAGIIRYDAYLRFYELGESELFRSLGLAYRDIFSRFKMGIRARAASRHSPHRGRSTNISTWGVHQPRRKPRR